MGQHKHHLVMGGGQHQFKKLCIWGLSIVIPFLVLFCIFPSGSSVYRPPNDLLVVNQLQVPPLHASRSDLPTLSSDEASDAEAEDEPRTSILDEPDFEPKKAKRHRGGKKKVRKNRRKKGSDDPIITPLMDKVLDEQINAEDKQKINHDEETISDTAIEEEIGKKAANQDDEALAAATSRTGRHKLDKEEEEEEEISPWGKEVESHEEDPSSPKSSGSKREGFIKPEEENSPLGKEIGADAEDLASSKSKGFVESAESNAAAAGDAVFFPDIEKTDDSIADAEGKKKTSKAKESSTQSGKVGYDAYATEEQAGNDRGASDLLVLENAVEEVVGGTKQSGKCRYYEGKWIIDSTSPSEDSTCSLMSSDDQQICALERNKTEPLGWRWQPSDCKVEHFQAKTFLKMMQRKSLAFVGDKLAKAQMESLLCILAQVEKPSLIYEDKTNKSSAWQFSSSNFTITMIWSPHLVQEVYENGYKKLHLDRLDTTWAIMVPTIDVLILRVGSRFIEPAIYTVHNEVVGCSSCNDLIGQNGFANMQEMSLYSGFRATMRSALMGVGALPGFEGITLFLQPYGFEGNGSYHFVSKKMKDIQEEELNHAHKRGSISNQSKMEVLHTDFISMSKNDNMQGPTTSTCLVPSPLANTWNEFLQHTLTRLLAS